VLLILVFFAGVFLYNAFSHTDRLQVVSGATKINVSGVSTADAPRPTWTVSGLVLSPDSEPLKGVQVWATGVDNDGRLVTSTTTRTGDNGEFMIKEISDRPDETSKGLSRMSVWAYLKDDQEKRTFHGQDELILDLSGPYRAIQLPATYLWALVALFFGSVLLGLTRFGRDRIMARAINYYALVATAMVLAFVMVITIGTWLQRVNEIVRDGNIGTLGYANIYQGRYAKDVEKEWLFSFTSPAVKQASTDETTPDTNAANTAGTQPSPGIPADEELTKGFGAPLWVLLLAALGSCLFTISILVKQVENPVEFDDDTKLNARKQEVLRHQFYVLFSPISAILVYQMMVAAGSAGSILTVAFGILAAGIAMNLLLDKAVTVVQGTLGGPKSAEEGGAKSEPPKEQKPNESEAEPASTNGAPTNGQT
jgi:hypothetical protein